MSDVSTVSTAQARATWASFARLAGMAKTVSALPDEVPSCTEAAMNNPTQFELFAQCHEVAKALPPKSVALALADSAEIIFALSTRPAIVSAWTSLGYTVAKQAPVAATVLERTLASARRMSAYGLSGAPGAAVQFVQRFRSRASKRGIKLGSAELNFELWSELPTMESSAAAHVIVEEDIPEDID